MLRGKKRNDKNSAKRERSPLISDHIPCFKYAMCSPQLCWKQRSNIPASHGFGFYYVYTDGNVRHLSRLRFQNQASAEGTHFFPPSHSVPGGCSIYIGLSISGHILVSQMYHMHFHIDKREKYKCKKGHFI